MSKKWHCSLIGVLESPSAIFEGTEMIARLICELNANFSSIGNLFTTSYTLLTSSLERVYISRFLYELSIWFLSVIRYPLSVTRYPLPVIRYPLSVTRYPLSVTRYPLSALNPRLSVWGGIDGAELAIEVLEVTCLADHGCVVGGIGKWRDVHRPAMTLA